jgi:hypothetical protein
MQRKFQPIEIGPGLKAGQTIAQKHRTNDGEQVNGSDCVGQVWRPRLPQLRSIWAGTKTPRRFHHETGGVFTHSAPSIHDGQQNIITDVLCQYNWSVIFRFLRNIPKKHSLNVNLKYFGDAFTAWEGDILATVQKAADGGLARTD